MSPPSHNRQDLHAQTARIDWRELERPFARGVVLRVAADLDLVAVATCFANDDKDTVAAWMDAAQVAHLDLPGAQAWAGGNAELWAVVVAPWVLVQERRR